MAGSIIIPRYNCSLMLNASATNQTVYWNYTIWVNDAAGNSNKSSMYFFKVDNTTPTFAAGLGMFNITNTTNLDRENIYQHHVELRFNVTSNNTDSQVCWVRPWILSATSAGLRQWTLVTTTNFSGTYGSIGSLRNCTIDINGTDIKDIVSGERNAQLRLEPMAIDNMGHLGYGNNFTLTYNYLTEGWNPIGWIGANTNLRAIAEYVNRNATYVSVWNNDFNNASWITWQYHANGANTTLVSNGNYSGV